MNYSQSRAHYAGLLASVVDDREEVVITRAGKEPVVIVSLDDYESMKETSRVVRSPRTPAGCASPSSDWSVAMGWSTSCSTAEVGQDEIE